MAHFRRLIFLAAWLSADFCVLVFSYFLAIYIRHPLEIFEELKSVKLAFGAYGLPDLVFPPAIANEFGPYLDLWIYITAIQIVCLVAFGLFRLDGEISFFEDGLDLIRALGLSFLLVVAFVFVFRSGFRFRAFSYSRLVFILDWGHCLVGVAAVHIVFRNIQIALRNRNFNLFRVIAVGMNPVAKEMVLRFRNRYRLGVNALGYVANEDAENAPEGLPRLGVPDDLPELIRKLKIDQVFFTEHTPHDQLVQMAMKSGDRPVKFHTIPDMQDILPHKLVYRTLGGFPVIEHFRNPLGGGLWLLKRTMDLIGAFAGTILFGPLMLLIAVAIRLNSKGSALFKQERVGRDGRTFTLLKFRSMRMNRTESEHKDFVTKLIKGDADETAYETRNGAKIYKRVGDPGITGVGKILRRTSLDELPQLINVLLGQMSLVGPRPAIPYEVEQYKPWHRRRLDVTPGITGLWQISGRNRLPFQKMIELDLYYIEHWSVLLDVKIILITIQDLLFRRNGV